MLLNYEKAAKVTTLHH